MGRVKLVLGALALVVATFAAFSGPVMADELDCRDANRFEHRFDVDAVNCDGDVFVDRGEFDFNDNEDFFFDDNEDFFFLNPFEVDVDTEEVNEDSDLEGECFVTEIDWDEDGLISDWEIEVTCFVEDED
jgi:hypothetical protein